MSPAVAAEAFGAHFAALRSELPGLEERRAEAMDHFSELGLPTTRDEAWRFTPLTELSSVPFEAASAVPSADRVLEGLPVPSGDAHLAAFANGAFVHGASRLSELPEGVRVEPLSRALASESRPELLERIGALADPKRGAFVALNTALFADGALIEVDEQVSLDRPIWVLGTMDARDAPVAGHPRQLISIGAGSRVVLVEHRRGVGSQPSLQNAVTEIWVGRDAHVDHVLLQDEELEAFHVSALVVRQEAGSRFASHALGLGARLGRLEISVELAGEGAHAQLNGLYLARDSQLLDHHTTIDHAMPHTTSDELYKGILDERASGVFHGRIYVRPGAQKISAMQQNRNLLLSDRATINTKPQLEIFADDVRCSHGATVGQLDPDQLFYLRARGIEESRARALLTFGFASDVLRELPVPELRARLEERILGWVPGGETH